MTAALFPVAMLLVFAIMLLAFCYEPKSEIDPHLFAGARPYLSRAQQIDRALRQSPACAVLARALKKYQVMLAAVRCA